VYRASDRGTPQGGVISPLLANLYLHYTLDLWFQRRFQPGCTGPARLIRYADDYVACFKREADAKRFRIEMEKRLGLFGLEIAPEKTRILAFGPMAQQWAKEQGRRKAETFDFLGFTHYCTTSRNGKWFRVGRKTISRRLSVVKNVRPGLMLSDKTLRLVPKKESVVERFLYQNLLSRIYRKYIETAVGGTEAKNISQARLKKAPIWLPSLETQEAVTKTLISFDQTIEQAETNIESACLMLRALISNWVEVLHV
uniref:reverse transcriptase domain-containing protein n=1 Tax=Thiolapillus sp. TaxID=2017437 RepID=UPI003AF9D259